MSHLFPRHDTLQRAFGSPLSSRQPSQSTATPRQARAELFGAWSTVDDVKDKTKKLSAEATKEFEKASAKAQAASGKIELYSGKYYAACTVGGLMACVSAMRRWERLPHQGAC